MKKIAFVFVALCAFAAAAFAKPAKVNGWKDAAKIANKNNMEVVSNYTDYYVAKGNGGKDFAIYAVKNYADIKVTLAMSCVGGEVFSKTTCVDKENGQPAPIFTIGENDKKCVVANGGDLTYFYNEEGIALWTEEIKSQRSKLLSEVAGQFGLSVSEK